jgi:hypothetical protein
MKLSLGGLKALCSDNIVELKFKRRARKSFQPPFRRMLCTLDESLLNSEPGLKILNFKKPRKFPAYNPEVLNLLTVWDIFMQDWRNIPVENVDVVSTVPSKPPEKFWEYFNKVIGQMSSKQKAEFINK